MTDNTTPDPTPDPVAPAAPPAPPYGQYAPSPPTGQPSAPQPAGYPAAPAYPAAPPAAPAPYGAAPYGAAPYGAAPYGGYAPPARTNTLAIVSLIASIAGIVIIPFVASIVGVITGHMALGQLKSSGEQGRGMALAGTIVGWVGLALSIIGVIVAIVWFSWVMSYARDFSAA